MNDRFPAPDWQDDQGRVALYRGDCLEVGPLLGRHDLILTDPPYGKVRGAFDHKWKNRSAMLEDVKLWRDMMFEAMKPNATLYWFAWPTLAGRIEAIIAERLNLLSHIVWKKPSSLANKMCPQTLRSPAPETERIIMAEHYGADNMALGESGYQQKCDEPRGFVFEPLRAYFDTEKIRSGVSNKQIMDYFKFRGWPKYVTARHTFSQSQWELPTEENYERLRDCFSVLNSGGQYLRREYEDLRREYEGLRREYENLRRYFELQEGDPKTEIWNFKPSGNRNGHPTEKPLDLISFMVRVSCRPNGSVFDPFMGSGTTGVASVQLGRRFVGIEINEGYFEIAKARISHALNEADNDLFAASDTHTMTQEPTQ